MSLAAKTEETNATTLAPVESPSTMTTTATTPAITETANPTPVAMPAAIVAPAKTIVTDQPALATQEVVAEPIKNEDKSEESPRTGLLKGFQQRLAGVFPKKSEKGCENKEEKKSHTSEDKKEDRDEDREKEKEKSSKQLSVSRKRNSLLGGLGIGKKEEKIAAEESHAGENTTATGSEQSQNTEPVVDKATETESTAAHEAGTERPVLPKRTSIFDTFRSHFAKKDKSEAASPVKETEAVSDSAPVIPAVGTLESPTAEAVAVEDVPEPAAEVKTEKGTNKYEKRKSSLPFGLGHNKKEKVPSSDEETVEKPLSPFAKLRATVKSKASPKFIADKKEENSVPETKNEGESTKPSESKETETTTYAATTVAAPA